jgi:PAS domain S-box-containing protein
MSKMIFPIKRSPLSHYAASLAIFLITLLLRFLVAPVEAGYPFLTFYPGMVVSFYLCGIGPGVLFVALAALGGYYIFVPPFWRFSHEPGGEIAITTFLVSACLIGWVVRQLQNHTEQLRAALSLLKQSEQHYQALLEDQTEMICRFKADGTILYVNNAYCCFFGKPYENVIGKKWHSDVREEDIPLINDGLISLSPENPVMTIESRAVTSGEAIRWGQFVNRAFFDEGGRTIEFQTVGRDITERRNAEETLKRLNETLERRVREETEKSRQKDHLLIQQSRLAAMGDMIGNIAHQWRQPLNALALVLANIEDAASHQELTPEYRGDMIRSGERLIQRMSAPRNSRSHSARSPRSRRLSSWCPPAFTITTSRCAWTWSRTPGLSDLPMNSPRCCSTY